MNPVSKDIADHLVESSSGFSLVQGTDLFIGQEPNSPDKCVTVYDRPGLPPEVIDVVYDKPGFMVRVRGEKNDYAGAYAIAQSIKTYLHKITDTTINSTRYIQILVTGDVNFVKYDTNNRPVFTLNFLCHRSS